MLFRPSLLGLPLDSERARGNERRHGMASVMMDDDAAAGCAGSSASCRCRPKANGG